MIRDLLETLPDPGLCADVCIVGAGAAGILLAVELIHRGKTVTLLEGGGHEIEPESQETYGSEVVGLRHAGVHEGRFRAKGGTTTRWGGQILELDGGDFERRAWVPGSGWPLRKAELSRFYQRAIELEGLGGALRDDADVWRAIGESQPEFQGLEPYFSRWTPEPNFAHLHRRVIEDETALTVWLHANAVELILRDEQACGVRCRTLSGKEAVFSANRYVFCLGTIESSRFFLQPRAGGLPWNRSGKLGNHYQDHIDSNAARIVPHQVDRFHAIFDNVFLRGFKYHPKLRLSRAVQAERETLNAGGTMVFQSRMDATLGQIKATIKHLLRGRWKDLNANDVSAVVRNLPLLARQSWRYGVAHRAFVPRDAEILLRVHCEQEPLGTSSLSLSESRDSLGLLRTRIDWKISDAELHTIRVYAETVRRSLHGIAEVIPDEALMSGDREYVRRCDDSYHHLGGMRMGDSDAEGVVDLDLRLHGTKNVFVCSGAVFPTSGYSNPTHTVLALAMRLAEHLS